MELLQLFLLENTFLLFLMLFFFLLVKQSGKASDQKI